MPAPTMTVPTMTMRAMVAMTAVGVVAVTVPTPVGMAAVTAVGLVAVTVAVVTVTGLVGVAGDCCGGAVLFAHGPHGMPYLRDWHMLLRMTQEDGLEEVVRQRIRGLRLAKGWSLDALAARCHLSPSTLSRLETGHRRIALDQLVRLARALGTTLDQLVEPADDTDVVIRPIHDRGEGVTTWLLSRDGVPQGRTVAKMRIDPERPLDRLGVHPGRDWFTVLSGTAVLRLGDRTVFVEAGQAAEFSTMVPHAIGARGGPCEILTILDHDGELAHMCEKA